MTCDHCRAETSNGLALCDLCQMLLSKNLEWLPIYFRNLARWRPGNSGVRGVPGSQEPRLVSSGSDRVSRALDEAGALIVGWAIALVEDRPQIVMPAASGEASSVRVACYLLAEHLTTIGTLPWAGAIVAETTTLEARLRKLTESVTPGWYAGRCGQCDHDTYVVPGLTWVTCQACGLTTYARDHLETVLNEAREWVARPKALAGAVVALVDTEQSVPKVATRIRQWAHQGQIAPVWNTRRGYGWSDTEERMVVVDETHGHARYRLGDVLDRVLATDVAVPDPDRAADGLQSA